MKSICKFSFVAVASFLLSSAVVDAQQPQAQPKGPPNALQGFSQNRDEPVHIEAATLEVRDKDKVATFSGDVRVKQGDTAMRSKTLVVFYDQDVTPGATSMKAAAPGPEGSQKIKRLEARGNVVVIQKDQTATGDIGIFDMQTQIVTLSGNVVMAQGKNLLRGDRLMVDLTNGVSRVESGKNGSGRVQGLFTPSAAPAAPGADGKPAGNSVPSPMPLRPPN